MGKNIKQPEEMMPTTSHTGRLSYVLRNRRTALHIKETTDTIRNSFQDGDNCAVEYNRIKVSGTGNINITVKERLEVVKVIWW